MITDFGVSKPLDATFNQCQYGMAAYIDPLCIINSQRPKTFKSDIYSYGVLLWEISSARVPFDGTPCLTILIEVSFGKRESPVEGTPSDYEYLYQQAWHENDSIRPSIDEILETLQISLNNQLSTA